MGGVLFKLAKSGFAVLGEDLGDLFAGLGFNPFIGVNEFKAQIFSNEASHRGFAGAHEPNNGKVVDDALNLHGVIKPQRTRQTQSVSAFPVRRKSLPIGVTGGLSYGALIR